MVHARKDGCSLFNTKLQQFFGLSQGILFLAFFGGVPGQLREPNQVSTGVAQSCDNYAGPKARPVFADTPALVLALPIPCRASKNILGLIIHQVFLRVEDGEMLSDDFF